MKFRLDNQNLVLTSCVILFGLMGCVHERGGLGGADNPFGERKTNILPANKIAVEPPRSLWLPGMVFKGSVEGDKINVTDIICPNIFPKIKPNFETLAAVKSDEQSVIKFGASLNPLESIIGKNKLSFDLAKFEREKNVTIDPGKVEHVFYSVSDLYDDNGEYKPISGACQAALRHHRGAIEKRQIFLVTAVVAQTGINYKFNNSAVFESTIKANFEKLIDASASAGYEKKENGGITEIGNASITTRTAEPALITEWIRSGAVSDEEKAKIKLEKLTNIQEISGIENAL